MKKLITNIFFKLFIGILVLSFVFFGVSDFLLNGSNSFIAKVDGKKISYSQLQNAMNIDRQTILRSSNNNEKALQYVESNQFVSDVLTRLINKEIVRKLSDNFGVDGSKKLILQAIANDSQFKYNGKFDRQIFKSFLLQNGFDEDSYVHAVQNEVVATMIITSLSSVSPSDSFIVEKLAKMQEEKRIADVIVVSKKNIGKIAPADDAMLMTIYEKNKQDFIIPQYRQASHLTFSKKDLIIKTDVSEAEIVAYYQKNKELYKNADRRDFYHILFAEEENAQKFLKEFEKLSTKNIAENFIKTAQRLENKSEKSLILANISKKDLIPEIGNEAFKLKKDKHSQILISPLGYHILLLKEIRKGEYTPIYKVHAEIKKQILVKKEEDLLQDKIDEIENLLISSNSLQEVLQKFNIGFVKKLPAIDAAGNGKDGKLANILQTQDFVKNIFSLSPNKVSALQFDKENNIFYAIKIDKIEESLTRKFSDVKSILKEKYKKEQELVLLKKLANKIADEIKQNPSKTTQIVSQNGLKIIANKEFPRSYSFNFQGQIIPYANKFLEELFTLEIGDATSPFAANDNEFNIGILRKIKTAEIKKTDLILQQQELANEYRNEILQIFNNFLQEKHPIKVNEKFLKQIEASKNNDL
ncbi:MAG TPA: SurA N-terminal domain-containing protein [Rickettsiales bacterium]|nr:SurA N-terminal domain-containing protein [Rickettsiales bacterium]